ncbi:unnamed protein product, partial [marine sediment metagenome]
PTLRPFFLYRRLARKWLIDYAQEKVLSLLTLGYMKGYGT